MSNKKRKLEDEMSLRDYCDPNKQLEKLTREVEPVVNVQRKKDDNQPHHPHQKSHNVKYRPTYKAELAKRGYLVQQTLGSGSYSKVKMALNLHSEHSSDKVAVKIIERQKAPRDYQEKFLPRELDIWPRLNHPNIAILHEYFMDTRRVYMILEYADQGDVLKYIQANGSLTESMARRWIVQIADAVRYMHNMDITHRDLKLENLLIDSDGNIKLCDFGFVKDDSSQMFSHTYCGSKSYAAPEILMGKPYDPIKSDVWALGVILYIFVTGKMPFDETKGTKSILQEQAALAFRWNKHRKVSEPCKHLIHTMFTWEFDLRPHIIEVLSDAWFRLPISKAEKSEGQNTKAPQADQERERDRMYADVKVYTPPNNQN